MPEIKRPLSPHLGVYKWEVANTLSIFHRAAGVFLSLGMLVLAAWIISAAMGQSTYDCVLGLLRGPLGIVLLFGLSAAVFFHLGNGIRHLVWDAGYGFDKHVARISGWFVFLASLVFTGLFWLGVKS
jgi:succinate dehydrogenase / fumarate reductase cytochrome b subunit